MKNRRRRYTWVVGVRWIIAWAAMCWLLLWLATR